MGSAGHDHHRRLVHEVLALRKELLSQTTLVLPNGNRDLHSTNHAAWEALLSLPPGAIRDIRDPVGPFRDLDAYSVLDLLEAKERTSSETVPVCPTCAEAAAHLIRRHALPFRVVDAPGKFCLCRHGSVNQTDLFFRLAVEVAGRPRMLIVGGNTHIDNAARRIDKPDMLVARDHFRVDPSVVARVDALVFAGGMLGHKHSAPILEFYANLRKEDRPIRIDAPRPNANTVALAIIAHRRQLLERVA